MPLDCIEVSTSNEVVTRTFEITASTAAALAADRHLGHRHVMEAFPPKLGEESRRQAGVLWHIDPRRRRLTVRHLVPMTAPALLGSQEYEDLLSVFDAGATVQLAVEVNCQKTPSPDVPVELRPLLKQGRAYRSRLVIVPEAERPAWAERRLRAIGVEPRDVTITPQRTVSLGRKHGSIPFVEVRCTATVTDPAKFAEALRCGVGKGKNYGLGLIRLSPTLEGAPA